MRPDGSRGGTVLSKALDKLDAEIREGLRHGFFDYEVSCQLVKGQKRELTIKAGKSHRYIIPEGDLLE